MSEGWTAVFPDEAVRGYWRAKAFWPLHTSQHQPEIETIASQWYFWLGAEAPQAVNFNANVSQWRGP